MGHFALIGHPVAQSGSPRLFAAAYGGRHSYELLDGASFGPLWQTFLDRLDGINITAPYKLDAFRSVDHPSERSRLTGAVNLAVKTASGIAGYNANASTSLTVSYNVGFLIAPNKGTTAGISTTANSSKDCFYIDQDDREIVANGAAEKTEYFMSSEEFVSTLNGLSFSDIWTTDDDEINDDYPVFKWEQRRF